ncbi:MAG: hypothetical protein LBE23_00825 [Vagococcus sp.]|jgi:hypothetical protein|nr:hypothetical protein [Vagococcus sp.]
MINKISFEEYDQNLKKEAKMISIKNKQFDSKSLKILDKICAKEGIQNTSSIPQYTYQESISMNTHFLFEIGKEIFLIIIRKQDTNIEYLVVDFKKVYSK